MKISEINEELKWSFGKYRIVLKKEKQGIQITVFQKMLLVSIPLYHIIESDLPEDDELIVVEKGKDDSANLMITYDHQNKAVDFKKDSIKIVNFTGNTQSRVIIEL